MTDSINLTCQHCLAVNRVSMQGSATGRTGYSRFGCLGDPGQP